MEIIGENPSEVKLNSTKELEFVVASLDGLLASNKLENLDIAAAKVLIERIANADVQAMISQEEVNERLSGTEIRLCIDALRWHISNSETMQLKWFRQNYKALLDQLEMLEQHSS